MKPQIIMPDVGAHNGDLAGAAARVAKARAYRDLSTVIVTPVHPGRGAIHPRIVQSLMNLMRPMNQKSLWIPLVDMEVGAAYSAAVDMILAHPDLSTWQYLLTFEDDNLPPADGLLTLLESIADYDAVGGLYWTKGPGGMPMIYGRPDEMPRNFRPQVPIAQAVQPCCGLGMGFTLFRLALFKDARLPRPWFRTQQEVVPGQGGAAFTQDLYFFNQAAGLGYRFASDNRVLVGHYDQGADLVW